MKFDLTVTDSIEGLEKLLSEATSPVVVWGHPSTGKSAMVSQIIGRHGGGEKSVSTHEMQVSDGRSVIPHYLRDSTHIVWEWANVQEDVANIALHYDRLAHKESSQLIMLAHPHTKELGHQLLGAELQRVCDEVHNSNLAEYPRVALPANVMEQSKHVAVLPSVERWLDYMSAEDDGVVVSFIQSLLKEDQRAAYQALYSFLFTPGLLGEMRSLSPRSWKSM